MVRWLKTLLFNVKVRGFVMGMKTMKTNDETIGLNLNPKHKKRTKTRTQRLKPKNEVVSLKVNISLLQ